MLRLHFFYISNIKYLNKLHDNLLINHHYLPTHTNHSSANITQPFFVYAFYLIMPKFLREIMTENFCL